ncbi:MAG: aminotransferase class V-fold PLP-dependent enzyme [Bacteroidales bacterium]|nr:aminotransferase class V-fold PLP-dependent enzyme [Bacteroidales bacterium]
MFRFEEYFSRFRNNIIGNETQYTSPYGRQKIHYFDWVASGRLYKPIEEKLLETFGPFVSNTHTQSSETGTRMTLSYQHAHDDIKRHVRAGPNDVIITAGSGMTTVVNKLQRILSLKSTKRQQTHDSLPETERPVVFITHMEHHSNHTSWFETIADLVMLEPDANLLIDMDALKRKLKEYENRKFKIGAFTACSNVTGIITPYHEMARIMHENKGLCFIDFAASAPYVTIDMHPEDPLKKLDAIYFSPHKFLGGPGSPGVLVFDSTLYHNAAPDNPGGGTVDWTNPWGEYKYVDDIEAREDGGTPGFLQTIRAALAIKLKEIMGIENIMVAEETLKDYTLAELRKIPGIKILADNTDERLGIVSFYHERIHFNLITRMFSDRFGIQVRGGCVCAGTYGHFLLELSYEKSHIISQKINHGDLSEKPGWVRMSLHPTMTREDINYFISSLRAIIKNIDLWKKDYIYNPKKNEFEHSSLLKRQPEWIHEWFKLNKL